MQDSLQQFYEHLCFRKEAKKQSLLQRLVKQPLFYAKGTMEAKLEKLVTRASAVTHGSVFC